MASNPSTTALTKCSAMIEQGLDPDVVTARFMENDVITWNDRCKVISKTNRQEKVNELITALHSNLSVSPGNFGKVVQIVRSVRSYGNLADALQAEYQKANGELQGQTAIDGSYHPMSPDPGPVPYTSFRPTSIPPGSISLARDVADIQPERQVESDGPPPEEQVYHVTTHPHHALAVIINNSEFQCKRLPDRPKSQYDVERLKEVLGVNLGFDVVTYRDLTVEEILKLFQTKFGGQIRATHDCFFCCIMSHGGEEGIYGIAGSSIRPARLKECLDGNTCQELAGKPKIMIFHSCRGHGISKPALVPEGPAPRVPVISPHSDFICAYSTVNDAIATLGENGAPYIQDLCEVLAENDHSLNKMLCIVNRKLKRVQRVMRDGVACDFVQTGEIEHTLQDFVFFHRE